MSLEWPLTSWSCKKADVVVNPEKPRAYCKDSGTSWSSIHQKNCGGAREGTQGAEEVCRSTGGTIICTNQ